MGTVVSIHVRPGRLDRPAVYLALAEVRARLHKADAVFSTWKTDSPVSRMRRGELDLADAPAEVGEVLARCEQARKASGGWFDPWAAPGGVDPTGLVKGWAAARALGALEESGVEAAMVSAGGDVAVFGPPRRGGRWRIGVQNPFDRSTVVAVAHPPGAIATSGCYERGRHIFDPFTGRPAETVASATVTGPDLALADALATAVASGGEAVLPWIEQASGYEALVIGHDGSMIRTAGFPDAGPAEVQVRGQPAVAPVGSAS